ncbi:hypothetical protein MPER_13372, partial [Moniliophthora perniciosa FA553]
MSLHQPLTKDDMLGAAQWVSERISFDKTKQFFSPEGQLRAYSGSLVGAVTFVLTALFVDEFEVPYIWIHKRDHLYHFDVDDIRNRVELLNLQELWRIYVLGQKYRS